MTPGRPGAVTTVLSLHGKEMILWSISDRLGINMQEYSAALVQTGQPGAMYGHLGHGIVR